MVSLIRNGPRMLIVETNQLNELLNNLFEHFKAESHSVDAVFDKTDEYHTILYLVNQLTSPITRDQVAAAVIIRDDVASVLCKLHSLNLGRYIHAIRPAPHTVVMRGVGNLDAVLERMHADFGGTLTDYESAISQSDEHSTVVCLTDRPLNRNMTLSDMHPTILKLDDDYAMIKRELKMHALHYLNIGNNKRDWNELEIRIFDSYGAFKLHYDRLVEVIDSLELGLVLGESWSKDYPRVMMPVEVYRVRLFTFNEPSEIKRAMLGLEYLADGTRIADFDVYQGHKKVYWKDTTSKKFQTDRQTEGLKAREEMLLKLDPYTALELKMLDDDVLRSRK